MPGQMFHRTLLPLLLLITVAGCTWPTSTRPTQSLPTRATAADVDVIDTVGVVEERATVVNRRSRHQSRARSMSQFIKSGPAPAVLFLGGSEGYSADVTAGDWSDLARHLAAQGFVTLQLCYFDCPERSQFLNRMEIVEVVRRWQAGESQRGIARATGLARATGNKYLAPPGQVLLAGRKYAATVRGPSRSCQINCGLASSR